MLVSRKLPAMWLCVGVEAISPEVKHVVPLNATVPLTGKNPCPSGVAL
jgi:hypothetical protein